MLPLPYGIGHFSIIHAVTSRAPLRAACLLIWGGEILILAVYVQYYNLKKAVLLLQFQQM